MNNGINLGGVVICKMAERTLQKVEDELTTCSVCLDAYTDPKLLHCFHVYCQGCLRKMVFRDEQGQLVLTCPSCRQVTPVPASGVAGLQSAFHINRLLGIMEEHKEKQDSSVHAVNSSSSSSVQEPATLSCSEHVQEELKLYCETCGKLICWKCIIKCGKHHDHDYDLLDKAFEKYKDEMSALLEPIGKQKATTHQALEHLGTCRGKITDQLATIEADIHSTIGRLQETLEARKTQLISQLHQLTQTKLKNLDTQQDRLETIRAQLGSCEDFVRKSMETDSLWDVLKMKTRCVKRVKELTVPFQPELLKPCTEADLLYSGSAKTLASCQIYGQLSGPAIADPSKCHATGDGLEIAKVAEKCTALLHAVNRKGEPCTQPISSLECELVSEMTGTRVLGRVERREQSQYKISYQPTIKGRHHLHIKVEGQHIRGSPFSVAVTSSIQILGTPIHIVWGVRGPYGMALNQKQELVVVSHHDHCVHVFSPSSEKILTFGSHGSGQGQFKWPIGVAVDADGSILVLDVENHQLVQKFTSTGKFITAVGKEFRYFTGIAFNSSNNKIYITDKDNHRVQVLNSDLTFSSTFGSYGRSSGHFIFPQGIACDMTGQVYVANCNECPIQVFTAQGKLIKAFSDYGQGVIPYYNPEGVAVDIHGMIYIIDGDYLFVLTPEGEVVKVIGGKGSEPGQFITPCGVTVDSNGIVYVCDLHNNRIQIF